MREIESERDMMGGIESLSTLGDFAFGSVTCGPSLRSGPDITISGSMSRRGILMEFEKSM
jgi:hypothetical protein